MLKETLTFIVAIVGAGGLGALLTQVFNFLLARSKGHREQTSEEFKRKADEDERVSARYREIVISLEEKVTKLEKLIDKDREECRKEISTLQEANFRLRLDNDRLRDEINALQMTVIRMRSGSDATLASQRLDALVVIDQDGKVLEFNPSATLLFHWLEREILGKPINILIPPEYRDRHKALIDEIIAGKRQMPSRDNPSLSLFALTREGDKIPVEINLSGWNSSGRMYFGASIRRRLEEPPELGLISPASN